ncbi:MAG: baseplate J/gp47 family protein [Micromonosporaceae bacterium]|nr:baseplate J/gp47 family protein [Micromonosporaceae bacterium]
MTDVRGVPVDYTNLGYEALRAAMLDIAQQTLPEWTDHSENDLGVLLIELFAYASDLTLYYQSRIAAQLFPGTSDEPVALTQLLRLLGYELAPPTPSTVELSVAVDAGQALPLSLPAGTAFLTTTPAGEQLRYETPQDVTITAADLGPTVEGNLRWFAPVPAVEGHTVSGELLGVSDGSPNQLFQLSQQPVIAGSVLVTVAEPGGDTRWQEVPTLATASPGQRCFVVQRGPDGSVTLLFGDGFNGMIPPRGATVGAAAEVTATYRVGGGPDGNVPAGTAFTTPVSALRAVLSATGGTGGEPAESLDRARARAPRLFRAQERAVTADDYVELALRTPGVGKARAVPLNWNDVLLYVAPSGRVEQPSELLRRDLLAAFESARMVSTGLRIIGPQPVDVYIDAVVRAQPYFLQSDVVAAAQQAVGALLAFDNVDFGAPVFLSRVYDAVQSLTQVTSLTVTRFSRDPAGGVDAAGVLTLEPFELARPGYPEAIRVSVEGGVVR